MTTKQSKGNNKLKEIALKNDICCAYGVICRYSYLSAPQIAMKFKLHQSTIEKARKRTRDGTLTCAGGTTWGCLNKQDPTT